MIVLAEIKSTRSRQLLTHVLQNEQANPAIRAGAAWALGEQHDEEVLPALINAFNTVDESIKIEAARALSKLAERHPAHLVKAFAGASVVEKPGIAWALANAPRLDLTDLLSKLQDPDSRQWAAYIVGKQGQEKYMQEMEDLEKQDPEVYFAVTVLWKIMRSWVFELKAYG